MDSQRFVMINGHAHDAFSGRPLPEIDEALKAQRQQEQEDAQAQSVVEAEDVHVGTEKSSTLNRHYVRRAVTVKKAPAVIQTAIQREALVEFQRRRELAERKNEEARQRILASRQKRVVVPVVAAPQPRARFVAKPAAASVEQVKDVVAPTPTVVVAANEALRQKRAEKRHMTPFELKDRAIARALERTATMGEVRHRKRFFWQNKKFISALSMSAAAIVLVGYLVYLNVPNISIKVAAMRAGIEATYPGYRPSGYSLKGLVAFDKGSVKMNFSNGANEYTLSQQKSAWDSMAVLNSYVRPNWGENFSISKERGLTIYTSHGRAAWVNGGVLYTIDGSDNLTDEQLRNIVVSL